MMDAQSEVVKRVHNSLNALRRELEAQGVEVKVSLSIAVTVESGCAVEIETLPVERTAGTSSPQAKHKTS